LISTPQEIGGCFASMTMSETELKAALAWVELDPGFAELVEWVRQRGSSLPS